MQQQKQLTKARFTRRTANPTLNQNAMNRLFERFSKRAILFCAGFLFLAAGANAQAPAEKPQEKPAEKPAEKSEEPPNAAQIELLETKYRFETNGDSRKEVHALVKINSELGVRQFAHLNFDYNRSFQSVEIPLVHITHPSGGTADILPSAISDVPNPAVEKFPAYQDVRVKSVRILGLQPGDSLEYRVITTTTKPPLAPDFWLDHSFDRSGVVTHEIFQLDLPASRTRLRINPDTPSTPEKSGEGESARESYRWVVEPAKLKSRDSAGDPEDIALTTFSSWARLAGQLYRTPHFAFSTEIYANAELLAGSIQGHTSSRFFFDVVSQKLTTVDLPFDAQQIISRGPDNVLASRYGTSQEKVWLLAMLLTSSNATERLIAYSETPNVESELPRPSLLSGILLELNEGEHSYYLDPGLEVAPFGMIPAKLRGRKGIVIGPWKQDSDNCFSTIQAQSPFHASQQVTIRSSINSQGTLTSKVTYHLRGDNELLLRVTFHQTPKEKQLQIAQYLALSDGFRGKVTSVKTSDPYATDVPFEVEYELTQEKFVDWSKKPVRIPALLPLPGLPDVTKNSPADSKIELGPPLNIELTGTLRLPPGVTAQAPAGTSVKRDYATFASTYSSTANLLLFSRRLNFISQEIPSDLSVDLNAFIHAVQSDQSQLFVLDKPGSVPPAKPK